MATASTMSIPFEVPSRAAMPLHTIDPLSDRRWDDLAASHPRASAFHQRGWVQALAQTYGYQPFVLTSTPANQPLRDGILFCEVKSWVTGKRIVSLPFSDHCEPLLSDGDTWSEFSIWMRAECQRRRLKYFEVRPLSDEYSTEGLLQASQAFWFHTLDLTPPLEQIFRRLHKSSIRRRIERARREHLSYEAGRSESLLNDFYRLMVITRRRHRLLPQPQAWFRNLMECVGANLTIRVARKDGVLVAAMLTLRHRGIVIYKYGCSDETHHHLAGMPFLFWRLIEESKAAGAEQIDFGRTDLDNEGLTLFKDRFGTERRKITYVRYPVAGKENTIKFSAVRRIFSVLPSIVLSGAGRLVYRHLG
jgi:CelD/BcsL family acetyltransferase involved in cellulose biosynthesis